MRAAVVAITLVLLSATGCTEGEGARKYRECITSGTPAPICAARSGYEDGSQ